MIKKESPLPLPLRLWHYFLVMGSLYFLWGAYFLELTWINQVVFNYAVFYPVGFINGYFQNAKQSFLVYRAAMLFNILTYVIVITAGGTIPFPLVGLDFFTMFLFIILGTKIGYRSR